MFTEKNFIEAYFPNNKKDNIKVLYSDGEYRKPHYVPVDPDHSDFQKLLKIVTLDEIEEKTQEVIDLEFEAVKEIQRVVLEENKDNRSSTKADLEPIDMLNFILNFEEDINENKSNEERLFSLKIACFDLDILEDAPDEIKEKIRVSAHPLELINSLYDYVHSSKQ